MNTLNFLRTRNGLSMAALSKLSGVTPMDIVRIERGSKSCAMATFKKLADYFEVSVSTMLDANSIELAMYVLSHPTHISLKQKEFLRIHVKKMKSGNMGEDVAFFYELARHIEANSEYIDEIDPSVHEDSAIGCDILSRTLDGKVLNIEVKSSTGGFDSPFHISASELAAAEAAEARGEVYVIYRVIYTKDPARCGVIPISMEEFRTYFETESSNFLVKRKVA